MLREEAEILAPEERNRFFLIGKIQIVSAFLDGIDRILRIVGSGEVLQPTDVALQGFGGRFGFRFTFDFGDNLLEVSVFAGADGEAKHAVTGGHSVGLAADPELNERGHAEVVALHIPLVQREHEVGEPLRGGERRHGIPRLGGVRGLARQHDVAADDRTGETAWPADDCASRFGGNVVQGVSAIDVVRLQDPAFENLFRALASLFGPLEEKEHLSLRQWFLVQPLRHAQHDRAVPIVPALV